MNTTSTPASLDVIGKLAQERGLKHRYVYQQLGISQGTYYKLRNNPSAFTLAQLKHLAEVFQVPTEQLVRQLNQG